MAFWPVHPDFLTSADGLNVRVAPSKDSRVVNLLPFGTQITVVNIADGWARLSDGNFVSSDFIRKELLGLPERPLILRLKSRGCQWLSQEEISLSFGKFSYRKTLSGDAFILTTKASGRYAPTATGLVLSGFQEEFDALAMQKTVKRAAFRLHLNFRGALSGFVPAAWEGDRHPVLRATPEQCQLAIKLHCPGAREGSSIEQEQGYYCTRLPSFKWD